MIWILFACFRVLADEGMWPPHLLDKANIDQKWHKKIPVLIDRSTTSMRSVVQFPNCSGTLASTTGLILSNAHCFREALSTDEKFHASTYEQEQRLSNFSVYLTTDVRDVTATILKGTNAKTAKKYFVYRTKRNTKALLRSCHKASAQRRCAVRFDSIHKRYQLIIDTQFSDVRLVHIPAKEDSHIDFAFVRVYHNDKPLETPSFLRPKIIDPKSNSLIFAIGYPQHSHRYLSESEFLYLQQEQYPTLKQIMNRIEPVLQSFLLRRLPGSKAHLLYAMVQETQSNISTLEPLFAQETILPTIQNKYHRFLEWIEQDSNRLQYRQAIDTQQQLLIQYNHNVQTLLYIKWMTLCSDLLSSAQKRIGWREQRALPNAKRLEGYKNQDKEQMILHLSEFPKHLDTQLERALWLAITKEKTLEPIDQFGRRYPSPDKAFDALESEISPLLEVQESILSLNPKRPLPTNLWLELGKEIDTLHTKLIHEQKQLKQQLDKQNKIIQAGLLHFDPENIYPNADTSLRISFGSIQKIWSVDLFSFDVHTSPQTSFVQLQLGWFPYFVSNIDATHGSSGSPTFNHNGEWIGILFGGNRSRFTSSLFYTENQQNYHLSLKSILWYLSLEPSTQNLRQEMQIQE